MEADPQNSVLDLKVSRCGTKHDDGGEVEMYLTLPQGLTNCRRVVRRLDPNIEGKDCRCGDGSTQDNHKLKVKSQWKEAVEDIICVEKYKNDLRQVFLTKSPQKN